MANLISTELWVLALRMLSLTDEIDNLLPDTPSTHYFAQRV